MTSVVWIHNFLARHYNFMDDRVSFEDLNLDNYNHKSELVRHRICRRVLHISFSSLHEEEEFLPPCFARQKKNDNRKNKRKHRLQLSIRRVGIEYT